MIAAHTLLIHEQRNTRHDYMKASLETVLDYHQRTKHHLDRYAAGPQGLDWDAQPDPFRTFSGSEQMRLPLLDDLSKPRYAALYQPQAIPAQAVELRTVAALLELSFGLSAWKQYGGARWALRCNPSSGNLHPTEAYLVIQGCSGIADGIHHYQSRDHVLEQRCRFAMPRRVLPEGAFLMGLSSIFMRESWKYGERAFRYCQHDAGHALAALRYAAAALGWKAALLDAWGDDEISALLGLDRDADFHAGEREHPDLLLLVTDDHANDAARGFAAQPLLQAVQEGEWQGKADRLSPYPQFPWPVIGEVAEASHKPSTVAMNWQPPALPAFLPCGCTQGAAEIIRQRRSAQRFDGTTILSATAFFRMLDMTLPRAGVPPWDAIAWKPAIHLFLFVHRVDGLEPGLYLFLRNVHAEEKLRAALSAKFEWQAVAGCPAHFSMFRLLVADTQKAARTLSCHQDIASRSAFSLGMLAEYEDNLAQAPWRYRWLFWEAGILGQVLYLEAEAAGVRGTGIGCYFDDEVHAVLGIDNQTFQSLYHFTVGGPVMDERLQTLPAYAHLQRE